MPTKYAILKSLFLFVSSVLLGCNNTGANPKLENDDAIDITVSLSKRQRPNILFIYTDDQAPWTIGHSGNPQALTPTIDKLATQGMYFPNAYVNTPVCSPSRASLLTSQYGYEVGIDDWININPKAKTLTGHQYGLGLDSKYETWPEVLQDGGYYTGLIGKWHLGTAEKHHPSKHGYQEFVGFREGGATTVDPILEVLGKELKHNGLTVDVLTDYAMKFIENQQSKTFALSLHLRAPHYRFLPVAPEDEAPYLAMDIKLPHPQYPNLDTKKAKRLMREYLSSVRSIDRNIGRLMGKLEQLQLANNTLVIFTSDHGYNMAHNGMWHKGNGFWLLNTPPEGSANVPSGQRPNMYDNSIKVPLIVRWPEVVEANTINPSTMSNLDWFPTLVDIAQGQPSADNIIRGQSFLPAFLNPTTILSTDYYGAYSTLHQTVTHMRMYSNGQFKLIRDFHNHGRDEFYELTLDPEESNNLMSQPLNATNQVIVDKFDAKIRQVMMETNDPVYQRLNKNN